MSDTEDTSERSTSKTYGTIGLLANHPLITEPNESKDDTDESKLINKNNDNFDNEEIQGKMNDLIDELQSESITPDDKNLLPRKSITSGHLIDNQENLSTPAINNPSSDNPSQGPIRSMSESVLIDHHDSTEHPPTLPIQQDESSTDDNNNEEEYLTNNTNRISESSQQTTSNVTKKNSFDETTGFPATSRNQSASSKRSVPSASGNEKRSQLPDETGTDTDREVANISRRPSQTKSPLNRSQSSTPDNSRKSSANIDTKRVQSSSNEQKQIRETPTAVISPASRRESTNKSEQQQQQQQQISRPTSSKKFQSDENSDELTSTIEQLKLIKPGEQLQIPTNDIDNKRLNSPPPSPSTTKQMILTNPLLKTNSRPTSQTNRKNSTSSSTTNQSRRSSHTNPQQASSTNNQKLNSASIRKGSVTVSEGSQKQDNNRRSSKDSNVSNRASAKQKQERQSPKKSTDETNITSAKSREKTEKRLSTTSSENELKIPRIHSSTSRSTTPTNENQTNLWNKQTIIPTLQTTDDDNLSTRPQSPNVEQIAEHNRLSSTNKKRNELKKKDQNRSLRRSNSAESFNHIPLVDDKSLDSTSGNNTESEHPKPRRVKSKKKDVETNTDSHNGNHQQQELTSTKLMPDHSSSTRRRISTKEKTRTTPETESDLNPSKTQHSNKKYKKSNDLNIKNQTNETSEQIKDEPKLLKSTTERQTLSDTEQIISEKQKKRRRPKRISRTTQTYECVFRRMEQEQHDELRPTTDTDKNIQTKKSVLRPTTRSPRKHYPVYFNTDAFKIEELLPKQFPQNQRNVSKTAVVARKSSPPSGKLLILRPTLPFHHTDAVNVQRVSLQYAIDLIPNNENKSNNSTPDPRHKSNSFRHSDQSNNLPMIRSSSSTVNTSTNKTNIKEKTNTNKIEDRTHQRKNGGTV